MHIYIYIYTHTYTCTYNTRRLASDRLGLGSKARGPRPQKASSENNEEATTSKQKLLNIDNIHINY